MNLAQIEKDTTNSPVRGTRFLPGILVGCGTLVLAVASVGVVLASDGTAAPAAMGILWCQTIAGAALAVSGVVLGFWQSGCHKPMDQQPSVHGQ